MECLYCPIDRRYIKGNFRLDNDTQIDNERSIDNNDTSGATDPTQTEIVVDEIHPQNGINNSAITSSLQPLLTFPVTVENNSPIDSSKKGRKGSILIDMEGLPNQNGRHTRILLNTAGNLQYFV